MIQTVPIGQGGRPTMGSASSLNRAWRVHQECCCPHDGQTALVTVSGSILKLDSSVWIPVENSRPVSGQVSIKTAKGTSHERNTPLVKLN
jgi:hypothetical protein